MDGITGSVHLHDSAIHISGHVVLGGMAYVVPSKLEILLRAANPVVRCGSRDEGDPYSFHYTKKQKRTIKVLYCQNLDSFPPSF